MKPTTEKIVILVMSFVIFFCGVAAIYMHHGTCRTVLLTVVFVLLLAIAAWQTIQKLKNR